MIEKFPLPIHLIVDTRRIKSCHHLPDILTGLKPVHEFHYSLSVLGKTLENGEKAWFEDYEIFYVLGKILIDKDFYTCDAEDKDTIQALAAESLCLIGVYHDYDWQLYYSLLDKNESDMVNNQELVNDEIEAIREITTLLAIQENFERSEMTIKHRDIHGNIISKDNTKVDTVTYREFLKRYIEDKVTNFKSCNAYSHFGSNDLFRNKKSDLVTSNAILSIKMNYGLDFEVSHDYFKKLLNHVLGFQSHKNKSARRIFTSLIAKALMKFLNTLLELANPSHTPKLKDKHLYIFYALRCYGFVDYSNVNLRPLSGNYSQKEDYIRDLLKM